MKVILKEVICGPQGTFHPGERELPEDLARSLIEAGVANEILPVIEVREDIDPALTEIQTTESVPVKKNTSTRKKKNES